MHQTMMSWGRKGELEDKVIAPHPKFLSVVKTFFLSENFLI